MSEFEFYPSASMVVPGREVHTFRPTREDGCVFCEIVRDRSAAVRVSEWTDAVAIVPLDPVVEGHWLVIPRWHVADAGVEPVITGMVMEHAAQLGRAYSDFNLITSVGSAASQTVRHLHVHVVPRCEGDGLKLPWSK